MGVIVIGFILMVNNIYFSQIGDSIGTTAFDLQIAGSMGQRIMVDNNHRIHVNWTKMDTNQSTRYVAWNGRFSDGLWYGEAQASLVWSGYAQLDIIRSSNPDSQRTVIAYHWNDGTGAQSWIDIDGGALWGTWPNNPRKTGYVDYVIPYIGVAGNNNIVMASANSDPGLGKFRLFLTTDFGNTWALISEFDSCCSFSQFIRASHNPGSHKVVFVWTKYITDTLMAGNHDNNVWYILSTDGGVTWGPQINITDYQPFPVDSVRAYCEVNAVFDNDDNLHICWTGQKVDSTNYYVASKIFHWDENSGNITVVNSPSLYYNEPGGWWIRTAGSGHYGTGLPADQPQLVVDTVGGLLYCLWHGNDNPEDYSAYGYVNGELYGAYSTDNGASWSLYRNLTNTHSPGAQPGECLSEESMTACPYVVNDSIFVIYIEDKDAGINWAKRGRELTENPVYCWGFHKDLISKIDDRYLGKPDMTAVRVFPNPFKDRLCIKLQAENESVGFQVCNLEIYDVTGRFIRKFTFPKTKAGNRLSLTWDGKNSNGSPVAAGVYLLRFRTFSNAITIKVIKLKS